MKWEKLGRVITFPVSVPLEVEVTRDETTGRHFARCLHLGTIIEATATTRAGALAHLERLVEGALAKICSEGAA